MEITLAMCDHSNDEYSKGMKSYEWLLPQVSRHMRQDRGARNRTVQVRQPNERGLPGDGGKPEGGKKDKPGDENSLYARDGRLKRAVVCQRFMKGVCPRTRAQCQYLHPKTGAPGTQRETTYVTPDAAASDGKNKGGK